MLNFKVFLSLFSLNHFPNFETDRESPGMLKLFQSTIQEDNVLIIISTDDAILIFYYANLWY
jgi:hypothetical protein